MARLGLLGVLCVLFFAAASAQFVLPNFGGSHFATGMEAGPQSWPELVGKPASVAQSVIQQSSPNLKVYLVQAGSIVTMDFRLDRVRVFYDPVTNLVTDVPRIG